MVKKSKKRPKIKKKAKQRKQQYTTPVDAYKDLVRPKGVRFGQGWLPYVQRLTFEAIPPTSNYYGNFSRMNTVPQPPQGQLSGPTLKDVRAMVDEASQTTLKSTATTGSDPMPRRPLTTQEYLPLPVEVRAMSPSDDTVEIVSNPNVPTGAPSWEEIIPMFWENEGIPQRNQAVQSARVSKLDSALRDYWSLTLVTGHSTTRATLKYLYSKLTKSGNEDSMKI